MKKFNINHSMYIKLTKAGWRHLQKTVGQNYINNCIIPYEKVIDGETWYKLSCWTCFELMPPYHGMDLLFETNVLFDEEDLN